MNQLANLYIKLNMKLGEGPVWSSKNNSLYFIDTLCCKLYKYDYINENLKEFTFNGAIGCFALGEDDLIYIMLPDGLYSFNESNEELVFLDRPDDMPKDFRFNDGKCNPLGDFIVGSMAYEGDIPTGSLYKVHNNKFSTIVSSKFSIPNGLAWDLEKDLFYHIDTPTKEVTVYDYNKSNGEISNPRLAFKTPVDFCSPDGMAIDKEGMLWIAFWDGYKVARFNPNTGECIDTIELPCQRPTSVVFGGPEMNELFITTAAVHNADGELSGSVFKAKVEVGGYELYRYKHL